MSLRWTGAITVLIAAMCLLQPSHSQQVEGSEEDPVERRVQRVELHPISSLFKPSELHTIRSSETIGITPLKLEYKLAKAWKLGRQQAVKQLAKKATRADGGIDIESLLQKDEENELFMTPQQLQNQVVWAYALGSLDSVNRLRSASGRHLPDVRHVSRAEVRSHQRQLIKLLRQRQMHREVKGEDPNSSEMETNGFWGWGGPFGGFGYGFGAPFGLGFGLPWAGLGLGGPWFGGFGGFGGWGGGWGRGWGWGKWGKHGW